MMSIAEILKDEHQKAQDFLKWLAKHPEFDVAGKLKQERERQAKAKPEKSRRFQLDA